MAYRRYARSSRSSYRTKRRSYSGRRRSTGRRRRTGSRAQVVKIVVTGAGAGGHVPIASTVAKKGVRPQRRRF